MNGMGMKKIESRENPAFRRIDRIRRHKSPGDEHLLFLEGVRLCVDAIRSGVPVRQMIISETASIRPEVQEMLTQVIAEEETLLLSDRLFSLLADTGQPQGVAMLCARPALHLEQSAAKPDGLYLVLEGVSDPGNVGTLIRTADAFSFDAILILPQTASPFNDKAMRSSMGSCFHLPLIEMPDLTAVRHFVDTAGLSLYAADLDGDSIMDKPFDRPGALIIGNEAHGISDQARQICDRLVTIPMPGLAESLNAAAAGAILCHELRRVRLGMTRPSDFTSKMQ